MYTFVKSETFSTMLRGKSLSFRSLFVRPFFVRLFVRSFSCSFDRFFVRSIFVVCSSVRLFVHSFVCVLVYLLCIYISFCKHTVNTVHN